MATYRLLYAPGRGSQVLVIVGALLRPYPETHLNQMHEVRLIEAERVPR